MNKRALYAVADDKSRRIVGDFVEEFSDEFAQMSGRCLDVGSGTGDLVIDLILPKLNEKANLVCSDISEEMLNLAKEKSQDNRRVSFVKLDIETPDLPKDLVEQFDHVTSFWCLNCCQNMRQTFENIFNLLRPGGTTFLLFIASNPGEDSYKILEAMPRYKPYMKGRRDEQLLFEAFCCKTVRRRNRAQKDVDRWTPVFRHSLEPRRTLKAIIEDAGFEVHHCSVREKSYTFVSPDLLSEFVQCIDPFIDCVPAELKEDYKKDLFNEYARQCIIFNKNTENEDEYSILSIYRLFIVYLKKPLANN